MKGKIKNCFSVFLQSIGIAGVVIFVVCPLSCHISAQGIDFITGDYVSPKLLSYKIIDEKKLNLNFSEKVQIRGIVVNRKDDISSIIKVEDITYGKTENQIVIQLTEETSIGNEYVLGGIVDDKYGNSLTFSLPFKGYNRRIPSLLIIEVQPEYYKKSDEYYRCEFVKYLVVNDGNLFGLMTGSATNGKELDYYFPPIEVKKNDIIVVHFRNKGKGCIDELGENIDISTAPNSCRVGRDLWLNNTDSVFSSAYDVIYLKDIINNKIVDGFMYTDKSKMNWTIDEANKAAELAAAGIYETGNIDEAYFIEKVTPTTPLVCTNVDEILNKLEKSNIQENTIPANFKKWAPIKNKDNITVK